MNTGVVDPSGLLIATDFPYTAVPSAWDTLELHHPEFNNRGANGHFLANCFIVIFYQQG